MAGRRSHLDGHPLIPGFEPTGVGASPFSLFRIPQYWEQLSQLIELVHAGGGFWSVQMVRQGGMPHGPSHEVSGYLDNKVPHAMSSEEITWLVREYGESAAIAADVGADALELHASHDDLIQWFLSPLTNQRTDAYEGPSSPDSGRYSVMGNSSVSYFVQEQSGAKRISR